MNIPSQANALPFTPVANQATDSLRRDNLQRELIPKPEAVSQSPAEKGLASDTDKSRTPAQDNATIDFAAIQAKIEEENAQINENSKQQNEAQSEANNTELEENVESTEANRAAENEEDSEENSEETELSDPQVQQQIQELATRDREVRTHELAHAAVGGAYAGTPSYQYTQGPDGKRYVTDGEVSIDVSPIDGDPEATIAKLEQVSAAALAPAEPSTQDRRVASQASQIIAQAREELSTQRAEEIQEAVSSEEESDSIINDASGVSTNNTANGLVNSNENSDDFDQFINSTLDAQEQIAPSRSEDVDARATRIESFYNNITQANNRPSSSNFQISV